MLDYKGIEALYTVQELQSFEKAAKKLHITQSAVSQRIKGLESYYSEPVLIRTLPYRPTALGKRLIGHYKKLSLLEEELARELGQEGTFLHFAVALNRDSLETWFLELVSNTDIFRDCLVEIVADDQERTLEYLKNGRVSACVSTSEKEIPGGKATFLGEMEYLLVATPEFAKRYFQSNNHKKCLTSAPALKFDQNDFLHERYLEKFFGFDGKELNYQIVPSVRGFKQFALRGYGYGLLPRIDICQELKEKKLVELYNTKVWKIPLYWHSWRIESKTYQTLNKHLMEHARSLLLMDH